MWITYSTQQNPYIPSNKKSSTLVIKIFIHIKNSLLTCYILHGIIYLLLYITYNKRGKYERYTKKETL